MRSVSLLLLVSSLAACAPEGPSAYVTFNLKAEKDCTYNPSSAKQSFVAVGSYDISKHEPTLGSGNYCETPYYVHLLVNSNLRSNDAPSIGRAEPNILQLHSAEVRLMDINRATLLFNRQKPALPNPFMVTTNNSLPPAATTTASTGVAAIETIPIGYAQQLNNFAGKQILAEIQIFGTTTGDVDVDFKPFVYPIQICNGCLTRCLEGDYILKMIDPAEAYGSQCDDDASADGRLCVDPSC